MGGRKSIIGPTATLLNYYPKETKPLTWKDSCTPCLLQHYLQSQDMKATKVSMDRWMDKEDVIHIYNGVAFSHKQEGNLNLGGPWEHYTVLYCEISQRKTNTVWSHLYRLYVESFFFLRAALAAYGGSQATGQIGAVAAGQSHSNPRSELHLRPTLQLRAMLDP